jgi:cytochrome c oxidase subunit IV
LKNNSFRLIALFEVLGGLLLTLEIIGYFTFYIGLENYLAAILSLLFLIPSLSLAVGGYLLWNYKQRGFLLSIIGQSFQTLFFATPWFSYTMLSPVAITFTLNTNSDWMFNFSFSTDFTFWFSSPLSYSEIGINFLSIGFIIYLFHPFQLLKEYGRLPRKLKCENCNTNYGWDAEFKKLEIKCEYCCKITIYEQESFS